MFLHVASQANIYIFFKNTFLLKLLQCEVKDYILNDTANIPCFILPLYQP